MTFEQILSDLKNKVYHPIYFLMGEEPYFIDVITDYIAGNVLDESEKEFNQTILYGRDTDVLTIISQAKRFPMMASHQVVIIKEAQSIRNIEDLLPYIENPLKSTLLVICYKYKTLDKRKKFTKEVGKNSILFEAKKLYENQIQKWINVYLKEKGYQINPKASLLLTEFLGTELSKIANELEKLMLNIPPPPRAEAALAGEGPESNGSDLLTITAEHIEENIGISKDFNNFELHNALGTCNILKANQIINYFAANPKNNPLIVTISLLYSFFSKTLSYHHIKDKSKNNVASLLKISPYFVRDYDMAAKQYDVSKLTSIISLLRECDTKSKGLDNATTTDGELLKELVYKIMH